MDKGQFLIETHRRTGRPIAELAAARRGEPGLALQAPCPLPQGGPGRARAAGWWRRPRPVRRAWRPDLYEDEIVRVRKELIDAGFDAGAETIHFHMATPGREVPSPSTIYRVLQSPGLRHLRAAQAPQEQLDSFRGRVPQRVLAGRCHPRRGG